MTNTQDPQSFAGGAASVRERPAVDVGDGNERLPWLKWVDRFSILLAALGGLCTAALMINIVIDVVSRNLFDRPFEGALDLTQFVWMPCLVALGLGYALLRSEHIRVNLLTAPTAARVQRVIEVVGMIFTMGVVAMFIWFGVEKAAAAMELSEKAVGTRWLAIWPFRWVVALGLLGLLLQACAQLLRAVTDKNFKPADEDEAAVLEAEEPLVDDLELEPVTVGHGPAAGSVTATTVRVENR
jgi:TRAP-type mannitol/chloroaromatic compound transport system permease small subunit